MAWDDYWAALYNIPGIGPKYFLGLNSHFGSPRKVFEASRQDLLDIRGITDKIADQIIRTDPLSLSSKIKKQVELVDGRMVTLRDAEYPSLLRTLASPPPILFIRGSLEVGDKPAVCMVGMRMCSHRGKVEAMRISKELAELGIIVVSGLARGIDTAVHQGALKAGGKTLALLGTGIDRYYPAENKSLQDKIVRDKGAIISVFPPGRGPRKGNFPMRNHVMAGMCSCIVVVEAGRRSGSLITSRCAAESDRDVYVVKEVLNSPNNDGGRTEYEYGAKKVSSGIDIIRKTFGRELLPSEKKNVEIKAPKELSETELRVWEILKDGPKEIEEVVLKTKLSVKNIALALTKMEFREIVRMEAGKYDLL